MKFPRLSARASALLALSVCLLAFAAPAYAFGGDKDWKPVDPAQLSMTAPVVEKDADAEALFWEVYVDDSSPDELSLRNYVRIKVFNERGRDSQSKVDIPFAGGNQIKDIAARVIKPDGTISELQKEDVFERTVIKLSGVKVKVKSFALPGVEPGAIIEYRWREVHPGASADRLRLKFQRDIPVESVTYYIKPYVGMHYRTFNMADARFTKDKDGFSKLTMTNMPAFHEEPRMPPDDSVRAWVFLYYTAQDRVDPESYWKEVGKRVAEATKDDMKVGDEVKSAAATIVGDAKTPEEKLQRIYDFCRTKIKNVSRQGLTAEERAKFKPSKTPAETLKRESGTGSNVDYLFAALARAAGFDARLALSGNADDIFFDRTFPNMAFLGSSFIAVRVGDAWQFYSPAEMYTPFGMLGWREEGQDALVLDPKEPVWVKTPVAGPEKSAEKRTAKLALAEDGTLEGDVRIEYTGQLAYERKEFNEDDSPAEREKTLTDMFKARMGNAELTNIQIENVNDPVKPFAYSFHVRVPGYAQRTGKRLFLQPAFFQRGLSPLFPTSDRKQQVFFHFSWSEEDDVQIALPEGFTLDHADMPPPADVGLSKYEPHASVSKDGRTLIFSRKFFFGKAGEQELLFAAKTYPTLKAYFDVVNKGDGHTIALKQDATTASN
jgi:transglutaminase-like putative cysteine protease